MSTGFADWQKAAIMLRDGEKCCLCDKRATVVNHRKNRGAGGRESLNRISNGCALCWSCNDLIERDADLAAEARRLGIKLDDHESLQTPLWSAFFGLWLILHDAYCLPTGYRDRNIRPDTLL